MSTSQGGRKVEELKSLVVQTLETNGVLGQIRAQLRANVYKAIDCDEEQVGAAPAPVHQAKLTKSPVGKLMAEIVAEFFEFYQFRHSLSVFLPESNLGKERRPRTEVAFDAGLARVRTDTSILEQLIGLASGSGPHKGGEGWHSSASSTTASSPPPQLATSMASTRQPAWETATTGSDTPPTGQLRGLGERTRTGGLGGAAAVADALSSAVGRGGTASDEKALQDEAKTEDEPAADEVARERRKPLGKLPSLSPASPLSGSGKDLLPPLRSAGLGGSASHSGSPASGSAPSAAADEAERSASGPVGSGSEPLEEDRQFDRHIARLNRPVTGGAPLETAKEEVGTAKAAAGKSAAAPAQAAARSASRSPATSHSGSPERSPAESPAVSPAGSSRSNSRSIGSPSEVQEVAERSMGTASEPGTPAGTSSKDAVALASPSAEDSMDDSEGSGDLDLTGGRGAPGASSSGGSSLAAGPTKRAPVSLSTSNREQEDDQASDEVEECIEEAISDEGEFSMEAMSEANASSNDQNF